MQHKDMDNEKVLFAAIIIYAFLLNLSDIYHT